MWKFSKRQEHEHSALFWAVHDSQTIWKFGYTFFIKLADDEGFELSYGAKNFYWLRWKTTLSQAILILN